MASRWERIGAAIGDALGRALDPLIGDTIRARYAAAYGTCRVCAAPLGGPSPDRICEPCHAGEVIARGFAAGTGDSPDA